MNPTHPSSNPHHTRRRGFSLMELLVVISIITILGFLAGGAFNGIATSQKLNQGLVLIVGNLETARLEAGTKNRPVEVRFLRRPGGASYEALQLLCLRDDGMEPLTPIVSFPQGVVIAADERSTLLAESEAGQVGEGAEQISWEYRSYEISPTGETSLPHGGGALCLAVGQQGDVEAMGETNPSIAAVLVDTVTGKTKVVRR